jgi:hypothetical protein
MANQRSHLAIVGFSIIGSEMALLGMSRYGPGLSADSIAYLGIARNLILGQGFHTFEGNEVTWWPPLYPSLLAAVASVLHIDPLGVIVVLNAITFGLIIYLSGRIFAAAFAPMPWLIYVGLVCTLLSPVLLVAVTYMWSEPIFILLSLLFLAALVAHWQQQTASSLAFMIACAALAALQRYAGITLIATGVLALLVQGSQSWRRRLAEAAVFALAASTPLALWLVRNYTVDGTLLGPRPPSQVSLLEAMLRASGIVSAAILPWRLALPLFGILALLVIIVAVVIAHRTAWIRASTAFPWSAAGGMFAAVYTTWVVVSAARTDFGILDRRLLSPTYMPLLIVILSMTYWLITAVQHKWVKASKWVQVFVGSLFLLWFFYPARLEFNMMKQRFYQGAGGYNSQEWHESHLMQYVQHNGLVHCKIVYSNIPDAIYLFTDLIALMSPRAYSIETGAATGVQARLPDSWPPVGACLVWMNGFDRPYLFTPEQLSAERRLIPQAVFQDGAIYTFADR